MNITKRMKKNAIAIISIISMLSFTLTNSIFIREANQGNIEFASNISNEYDRGGYTQGITDYSATRTNLSGNTVQYDFSYAEDGVWYWEQEKEDYVKRSWYQYSSDAWYYGPGVNLGDYGDDQWHSGSSSYAPTMTVKYTGDRPSHENIIYHPEDPGWITNPNDPNGMGDNPDTESIDESIDDTEAWEEIEIIEDNWPSPYNAFEGSIYNWALKTSYNPNSNIEYRFDWTSYNSKMSSFPKLRDDWVYVVKDEGQWNQHQYDHWRWQSSGDYWMTPDRAETGKGNREVFINWNIKSNDILIEDGVLNFNNTDVVETSASAWANSQEKPTDQYNNLQEHEKHSATPPTIYPPEPKDSPWYGVRGSQSVLINDLPIGWEYTFTAELKYVDSKGVTQTYDTFIDTFSTEKNDSGLNINIESSSDNEHSIKYSYEVSDPDNIRTSDIFWEFNGNMGTTYAGQSQSNFFEKTFDVLEGETGELNVEFEYATSNTYDGQPASVKKYTQKSGPSSTNIFYENEVSDFEIWVNENTIQKDSFVFNYYISTNNNWLHPDSKIDISYGPVSDSTYSVGGLKSFTMEDLNVGTSSMLIDTTDSSYVGMNNSKFNIKATLTPGGTGAKEPITQEIIVDTRTTLETDITMQLLNNEYISNSEAGINYKINKVPGSEDINYIKYSLNGEFYDLEYNETSDIQLLELENLEEEKEYSIRFEANTDVRDYYSNEFKFTTDRNTRVYFPGELKPGYPDYTPEPTTPVKFGEHSASLTFEVDKWEYLDVKEFTWGILDRDDNDKVIFERTEEITHNGEHTIFADGLRANNEYRFVVNVEIEGRVRMLYYDFTTAIETNNTMDNSFITNISKDDGKFLLTYEGKVMSVQYSINGIDWITTSFDIQEDNQISVRGIEPEQSNGYVSFRLNNQMRSQITYYDGVSSTLISPKDPIDVDTDLLVFWILIAFIVLTIIIALAWGLWYKKPKVENTSIEGNIWKQ